MTAKIKNLHTWALTYAEAVAVQERLRSRVALRPLSLGKIRHVAGSDLAISKRLDKLVAAVVVMSFPDLDVVETRTVSAKLAFPYIPGLLSFREIPALIQCARKVRTPFDVMLCDAQGIAHPRGLGLASHLGILIDTPTVGCAKSRLVGEHDDPGTRRGDFARLMYQGKYVGCVLRTRERVKPIFVSPGHLVDQPSSRRIATACLTRYRLPEPTRLAHIAAGEAKRKLESTR
jgi:deoxyribonuclease V